MMIGALLSEPCVAIGPNFPPKWTAQFTCSCRSATNIVRGELAGAYVSICTVPVAYQPIPVDSGAWLRPSRQHARCLSALGAGHARRCNDRYSKQYSSTIIHTYTQLLTNNNLSLLFVFPLPPHTPGWQEGEEQGSGLRGGEHRRAPAGHPGDLGRGR